MSWVNDLASTAGIPAGAATLAVSMYAACSAAEKAARPEALRKIGRVLKNPYWSHSAQPSVIIEQVFRWTFGERHLSWKCVKRSATATVLFAVFGGLTFNSAVTDTFIEYRNFVGSAWTILGASVGVLATLVFFGLLPDYFALWKTRYLVGMLRRGSLWLAITPVIDLVLSFAISYVCATILWVIPIIALSATGMYMQVTDAGISFSYDSHASFIQLLNRSSSLSNWYQISAVGVRETVPDLLGHVTSLRGLLFLSTLFTSIWTILILLSTVALKLLAPVENFTAWFFDVEKHPVQAIGIVSGALVMVVSLIWTVLRAVI